MSTNRRSSPLIVVLGPTGSGKSDLGLAVAEAFHGEIVNSDSVQVYRELSIGSAKLPKQERRGIPHHLVDVLSIDEELTAGAYSRMAREVLSTLQSHGKLPIVVGGTGFYLKALLDGLSPAPTRDTALRNRLKQIAARRPLALHRFLRRHDSAAATRIHTNDQQKLIRAVELIHLTGVPASAVQNLPRDSLRDFKVLKLGLDPNRKELYNRLNLRSARMFERGLIQETQAILDTGHSPMTKALQSVGYKQAVKMVTHRLNPEEAIRECQTRTRQYAKRQITWFRAEPDVRWLAGFGDDPAIRQEALKMVGEFLHNCE